MIRLWFIKTNLLLLEDENIIKRTNIRNIYVVNPIYIFRGDVNKLINIISEAKLIKTFDDKDRLIVDKFVLFKNDTDYCNNIYMLNHMKS